MKTTKSAVELDEILNTNLFDFERASQYPGWLKVMRGEEDSESDEYGVSSISFDARRPFHPERFHQFLHTGFKGLYRAKGYFWTVTQPDYMVEMAIVGTVREYSPKGAWWASVPESEWPQESELKEYIKENWDDHFGDRYQKLVFIGKSEILPQIKNEIEKCLLTDEEMSQNIDFIKSIKDPFENWEDLMAMNES